LPRLLAQIAVGGLKGLGFLISADLKRLKVFIFIHFCKCRFYGCYGPEGSE
jgi:hypothetical protein